MKTKNAIIIILCLLISSNAFSQAPNSFKYQSMLRKNDGTAVANQNISVRISILKNSLSDSIVYIETQTAITNNFGIINLNIGNGQVQTGLFPSIDWSNGSYYVKIEIDETGGNNYTLSSTSQLLSVPYALYATKAGNGFSGSYNDLTNKPDLIDTSNYLKTEIDPIFNNSIAKGISQNDTAIWNKISNGIQISNPQMGDLVYYNGAKWDKIEKGRSNQVLTLVNGKPQWSNLFPIPSVSTDSSYCYNYSSTSLYGSVNANGQIINIIFNYGTNSNCDQSIISIPAISKGYDSNEVTATLKGLLENTVYYYKVVVLSKTDTIYGNIKTFKTPVQSNSVNDIDGNVYQTVTIGDQVWMAENLRTSKFNNGDNIPTTDPAIKDITAENSPIYQWIYNTDNNNLVTYGRLYTWYATVDNRNICPTGWHVPSDEDWTTLADYLGGLTVAGGKLKETGTTHWDSPNVGASNESGFRALPAGCRISDAFVVIGIYGYFWSTTSNDLNSAWVRVLSTNNTQMYRSVTTYLKSHGFSVRCLRN